MGVVVGEICGVCVVGYGLFALLGLFEGGRREVEERFDFEEERDDHAEHVEGNVEDGRSDEGVLEEGDKVP